MLIKKDVCGLASLSFSLSGLMASEEEGDFPPGKSMCGQGS